MTREELSTILSIDKMLEHHYEESRKLRDRAKVLLIGKYIIDRPGRPLHRITGVSVSGVGHLSVTGVRIDRRGNVGTREFYIGLVVSASVLGDDLAKMQRAVQDDSSKRTVEDTAAICLDD